MKAIMKVNELRIGNIVQDKSGKTIVVDSIGSCQINFDGVNCYGHAEWEYIDNEIGPIELSPYWLFQMGFIEKSDTACEFETDRLTIRHHEIGSNAVCYLREDNSTKHFISRIIYVHEVQNLYFALTGKELTFNEA